MTDYADTLADRLDRADTDRRRARLAIECQVCRTSHVLDVRETDLEAWKRGTAVQDAMPYLSAADRELLLTVTCGRCWNVIFPPKETP